MHTLQTTRIYKKLLFSTTFIYSLAEASVTLVPSGTTNVSSPYSVQATVSGLNNLTRVDFINTATGGVIRSDARAPYCMFGNTDANPCNLGTLGAGTHHVKAKAYGDIVQESAVLTIIENTQPPGAGVSIQGEKFYINGVRTYSGGILEGTLPNSRMVNATFDDANPATIENWDYPNGAPYDPNRQTNEFIAALPSYKAKGLLAVTLNFQGGDPIHGAGNQPWDNTAFNSNGSLKSAYLTRMDRVIRALNTRGMVAILGYFYQGQINGSQTKLL